MIKLLKNISNGSYYFIDTEEDNDNSKKTEIYNILNKKLGYIYKFEKGQPVKAVLEACAKQFFPTEHIYCEDIFENLLFEKTLYRNFSFEPTDTVEDLFQYILAEVGMRMYFKNTGIKFTKVTEGSITLDLD